jgi:hypothetical protein
MENLKHLKKTVELVLTGSVEFNNKEILFKPNRSVLVAILVKGESEHISS